MTVPKKTALSILIPTLLFFTLCSQPPGADRLVGTWELEGSACDTSGECKKEIIVDRDAGETFTPDGLYLSRRSRNTYRVEDGRIHLGGSGSEPGDLYGEILSIKGATMLLKRGNDIMRFRRKERSR